MIHPYVAAGLLTADYQVDSDGSTYGVLQHMPDVSASGSSYSACRQQLRRALERYVRQALANNIVLPTLAGVTPPRSEADLHLRR
jgi:predicted RNase H-like HicB family nuclease